MRPVRPGPYDPDPDGGAALAGMLLIIMAAALGFALGVWLGVKL